METGTAHVFERVGPSVKIEAFHSVLDTLEHSGMPGMSAQFYRCCVYRECIGKKGII